MKKTNGRAVLASALSLAATMGVAQPLHCWAQAETDDERAIQREVEQLRREQAETRRRLDELEGKLGQGSPPAPLPSATNSDAAAALDRALADNGSEPAKSSDLVAVRTGPATLRLIDVSFDVLTAAGWSTEDNDHIEDLQGGAHDPQRRGFTLQQGELSLNGAVDPYFTAEGHIVFTPDEIELEEAFFTTTALPYGLQVQGGYFLTDFGLLNPTHPHAWNWIDQPIILTRLFGGDGLRAPGVRLGWLTPLPWFSEIDIGIQNAEGETLHSFRGDQIGGRPTVAEGVHGPEDLLYLARWNQSVAINDQLTALFGVSGLYGPNSSAGDAQTFIYGADLKLRWRPIENFRGWPFLIWQTEVLKRDYVAGHYQADAERDDFPVDLSRSILRDAGFYTQLLYGFHYGWSGGVRYEYASGSQPSVDDEGMLAARSHDPFRDDRHRLSPLVIWQPTEFSRFRLQYNYDNAQHISGRDAHSLWFGAEVLYGAHPAHQY